MSCVSRRSGTFSDVCAKRPTKAPQATTATSELDTNFASPHSFSNDSTPTAYRLTRCSQSDVDVWFAAATDSSKETLRPFLLWAIRTHHMRRLRLPLAQQMPPRPISLRDRVELLRRVDSGLDINLTERVIATLVLLYAQPLSRIVRLTVDDVLTDPEGRVLIRLGDPPAPIPSPFDDILRSHLRARHNLHTATNPNSAWLLPGRRAANPNTPPRFGYG